MVFGFIFSVTIAAALLVYLCLIATSPPERAVRDLCQV